MAAQVFWAVFHSSRQLGQIGPTADFDSAAIPPAIFSMMHIKNCQFWHRLKRMKLILYLGYIPLSGARLPGDRRARSQCFAEKWRKLHWNKFCN